MKRYIIEFDLSVTESEKTATIQSVNAEHINNVFRNFELIECDEETVQLFNENDKVIAVESDGICEAQDAEPADFPMKLINVIGNGHTNGYKGDNVVVAVIDSGIDYEHVDLRIEIFKCARILNSSIQSVDKLSDIKDLAGHGTGVTSIIAMQENDIGYVGIAPNVKLMVIKATDDDRHDMLSSDIAKSITWAVDNGAHIVNISYASPVHSSVVQAACEYAYSKNAIVVTSTGNNGNVNYWKNYQGVIVVGSVKGAENYSGKLLPHIPVPFNGYKYSSIYYNDSSMRYRLVMSDGPMRIDPSGTNGFKTYAEGYYEVYDYYPSSGVWSVYRNRTNGAFVIDWGEGSTISSTYPFFVYTNHNIVDNSKGGIVHTPIKSLQSYKDHLITNFGELLPPYDENALYLERIVSAPFSLIGDGIDFVAPGYFNLPIQGSKNGYEMRNGTSYSASFVAGVIAIFKQRFPHFTVDEIYRLLKDFAVTVGDGDISYYGNGLVTIPDLATLDLVNKIYYKGKENKLNEFIYLK